GIGRAIADRFAREGAQVAYTDIRAPAVERPHLGLALDVTDEAQSEAAIAEVMRAWGRLDILVNNAGIGTGPEDRLDIDKVPTAQWERILKVDLTGVFLVSRAGAAPMIHARSGTIINIA